MHTIDDLLYLMGRLRNPETGCPWDLKQDFASILPHTLEEAYEVADAIERQDWPHLEEELGDLLFQVIFYGQMADEKGWFNLHSIVDRLVSKLVRRHPHVFPKGTLASERQTSEVVDDDQINQRWEDIKREEKSSEDADVRVLDQVPATLPSITRAYKLQKKASSVGFDWPKGDEGVLAKIREELDEVVVELEAGNKPLLEKEIGDLIFAVINLARHNGINPDTALRGTNQRFYHRFSYVEDTAKDAGGWGELSADTMENAWQQAKRALQEND